MAFISKREALMTPQSICLLLLFAVIALELPHATAEHPVQEPKSPGNHNSIIFAEQVLPTPAISHPLANHHSSEHVFRRLEASTAQDSQVFLPTTSQASAVQPFEDADARGQASSTTSPSGELQTSNEQPVVSPEMSSSTPQSVVSDDPASQQISSTSTTTAGSRWRQAPTQPGYSQDPALVPPQYTTSQLPPVLEEANTSPMPNGLIYTTSSTPAPAHPMNMKKVIGPVIAGVAGVAAIGGVVAVSVMKNHKKAQATNAQTEKGSMNLQVPDANVFLKDLTAQKAVGAGIADAAGCKPEDVVLTVTTAPQQNLQVKSIVQVSYKIILSASEKALTTATVDQTLYSKTIPELAQTVQSRLAVAKGPNYPVAVLKMQVGIHPPKYAAATTSTLPPIVMQPAHVTKSASVNTPFAPDPKVAARAVVTSRMRARTSAMPGAAVQTSVNPLRTTLASANGGGTTTQAPGNSLGNLSTAGNTSFWIGVGGICVAWAVFACCVACILFMRKKQQRAQKRPAKESFMSTRSTNSFMSGSTEAEDSDPDEQPLMDKRAAPTELSGATPDVESQYMPVDLGSNNPSYQYARQAAAPVPVYEVAPTVPIYVGAQSMAPNQAIVWQASPYANMPTQNLLGMTLPPTVF